MNKSYLITFTPVSEVTKLIAQKTKTKIVSGFLKLGRYFLFKTSK